MTREGDTETAAVPADGPSGIPYALGGLGAAIVLTGLVFFATHAYGSGAGMGRRLATLGILYAASGAFFVLGLWLERRPGLRGGYSMAVVAGALAAVYYTTYAAHFVPALQVIRSPLVAAVLLLACAAGMLWFARRRRSRSLAVLAVLLALYASLIPPVGSFTLVSNAILAGAAFLFLVRNGWSPLPLALVAITYLTFAVRHLYRDDWVAFPLYLGVDAFLRAAVLLALYWALFTAPILLSTDPRFTERRRAAFLCLNSAFAWGLLGLVLPPSKPRLFAAAFGVAGAVFLGLTVVVSRRRPAWARLRDAARTVGTVLLVVAAAAFFVGGSGTLVLALVGLALAMAAEHVQSNVLRGATLLVSLLAAVLAAGQARALGWSAILVGAVLVFTAFWVDRYGERSPHLNPGSVFFSALGLSVWLTAALTRVEPAAQPFVLAVLAVALTGTAHLVGLAPAAYLSQAFLLAAFVTFLRRADQSPVSGLTVAALVAAGMMLGAWWRALPRTPLLRRVRGLFTWAYALGVVAVLLVWIRESVPQQAGERWLILPAALAIGLTLYAVATRDWTLGVLGQAFVLLSVAQFWVRWEDHERPAALAMLAPVVALVAVAAIVGSRRARLSLGERRLRAAGYASVGARAFACVMIVVWVSRHVAQSFQFALLEVLAVLLLVWAGEKGDRIGVALSTLLSTGAAWLFWKAAPGLDGVRVPDLVGFALLLAQQQLWRRRYAQVVPAALHDPAMVIGVGSLWRWAHVVTIVLFGAAWVGLGWALVGVAACVLGLILHERMYRRLGLVILAAATVRVAVLPGPDLPTLPRVVTVVAIGSLLLLLGFAYDRFRPAPEEVRA